MGVGGLGVLGLYWFRGLGFRAFIKGLGFGGVGLSGLGFRGWGFRGLGLRGWGFRGLGLAMRLL